MIFKLKTKLLSFLLFLFLFSNSSIGNEIKEAVKDKSSDVKIVFLSDTHTKHNEIAVPEADILIFCGDMCSSGSLLEVYDFSLFLMRLSHKYKVVIAGNHDRAFEDETRIQAEEMITSTGAIYLNDSGVSIERIKIWGSPIQPKFRNWAFNREKGEDIERHWNMIPPETDLLITHGPPYGVLDKNHAGEKLGCKSLFKKVQEVQPKLHAFGHIHEGFGKIRKNNTTFVNASNLNVKYQSSNPPIVIDWKSLNSK